MIGPAESLQSTSRRLRLNLKRLPCANQAAPLSIATEGSTFPRQQLSIGRKSQWAVGLANENSALSQEPRRLLLQRLYRPRSFPTVSIFRPSRARRKSASSGGFSNWPTRTARNWA